MYINYFHLSEKPLILELVICATTCTMVKKTMNPPHTEWKKTCLSSGKYLAMP